MESNVLRLFINRLEELGVETHVCDSIQELLQHLNNLVKNVKTPIPVVGIRDDLQKQLIESLKKENKNIIVIEADSSNPLPEIELSIGFPELGLSNTGTVIYRASSGIEEASLYFPETHVSIISKNRILRDIDELEGWMDSFLEKGESLYFITGPSSTADIEGEIVKGVHGPRKFYVFLYEGEER